MFKKINWTKITFTEECLLYKRTVLTEESYQFYVH